jgi:hypothetical protein
MDILTHSLGGQRYIANQDDAARVPGPAEQDMSFLHKPDLVTFLLRFEKNHLTGGWTWSRVIRAS